MDKVNKVSKNECWHVWRAIQFRGSIPYWVECEKCGKGQLFAHLTIRERSVIMGESRT